MILLQSDDGCNNPKRWYRDYVVQRSRVDGVSRKPEKLGCGGGKSCNHQHMDRSLMVTSLTYLLDTKVS
jgi:hypothetical protein